MIYIYDFIKHDTLLSSDFTRIWGTGYFSHNIWVQSNSTVNKVAYTVYNFGMDNLIPLHCLILTRNTLPLSSSLPLFFYIPPFLPFLPPSPHSLFFLLSFYLTPSIYIPFPLSLFPLTSLSPPSFILYRPLPLSTSLPLSFPSLSYFPSLYFAPLFFMLQAFSQSYAAWHFLFHYLPFPLYYFLPFSSFSSPSPPSLYFSIIHNYNIGLVYFNYYYNCMLLLQLFPAPQATSTRREGGQAQVDVGGWGWTPVEGTGSAPRGRPHRKLKPSDAILSSSYHAKKLAVYFMSRACGRPQEWKGINGQSYHYKIRFCCSIC